jgi:PIF1-like helicase/helix-turn-helix protein/HRDC domain-containing protein
MKTENLELKLAGEFVNNTGCNIFLTGKAGTGKTTFLHSIKKSSHKRMVVTAPTGVAAINAGGVTLHSFFQLPFGPFIPGSENTRTQYRFSREKIGIIKSLDLLVIDEISMVRADLLDGVDSVLRRYRRSNSPFGGVQLLMIGDLFQLPPVVKEAEWRILDPYYESPYFFSSNALLNTEMVTIELKHIYRQADSHFINLLNRLRNNRLDSPAVQELNTRHVPEFVPADRDGYITLCTHNRIADTINASRLGALTQKVHRFKADIEGDFPEHTYPTAASLELKTGAQVMFMRNDLSPEKRYFNGKIGTITRISGKDIRIKCPEDSNEIEVEPATWENINYTLDQKTLEITENKIGAFSQYPLKLAWAITIHKSQGLTFDKAIIDAQAAFAHGQVYVALSRCRTFEGMVLSTPLSSQGVKTDEAVCRFSEETKQNFPSGDKLNAAKIRYQQQLLLECFDFQRLRSLLRRMFFLLRGNAELIHISGIDNFHDLQKKTEDEICTVGDNFLRQLQGLFSESILPSADVLVLERIAKASTYFKEKIASGLGEQIPSLTIDSDNKELRKKARNVHKLLLEEFGVKLAGVKCCGKGFSPSQYFRAVSAAEINTKEKKKTIKPAKAATYSEADIAHPELFEVLKDWRSRKAKEEGVPHYRILHQKTLIQLAVNLPDTQSALLQIKGIGEQLVKRYGEELADMVCAYRKQHNIKEISLPSPPPSDTKPKKKKVQKINTKQITLDLFEKGLTLSQIVEERGLVLSTIEGHMAHFVETGKVSINSLLSPEKLRTIEPELSQLQGKSLSEIKQALDADVSYGDIKFALAHLKNLTSN